MPPHLFSISDNAYQNMLQGKWLYIEDPYHYLLKCHIWAATWKKRTFWHVRPTKNQTSVFVVRTKKFCTLVYQKCAQWRFWSVCADWSVSSLGAYLRKYVFWRYGSQTLFYGIWGEIVKNDNIFSFFEHFILHITQEGFLIDWLQFLQHFF